MVLFSGFRELSVGGRHRGAWQDPQDVRDVCDIHTTRLCECVAQLPQVHSVCV
jgi:hypothetical protein